MATRLPDSEQIGKGHGRAKYPWNEWMEGKWSVKLGEDFDCQPKSMVAVIYGQAKKQGVKVQTSMRGDEVRFEFYEGE